MEVGTQTDKMHKSIPKSASKEDTKEKVLKNIMWVNAQSKAIQDEIDSGLFLSAAPEFMGQVLDDWRAIAVNLQKASSDAKACVDMLESYMEARLYAERDETLAMSLEDFRAE